jgi:hypothetical protein
LLAYNSGSDFPNELMAIASRVYAFRGFHPQISVVSRAARVGAGIRVMLRCARICLHYTHESFEWDTLRAHCNSPTGAIEAKQREKLADRQSCPFIMHRLGIII